ncbi:hypothetical protein FKP32DRAFT_217929 [Trametes sanguinea]|nr:hypothetical protein FKP32DRAFT_217929 [Trametes sanguinea]
MGQVIGASCNRAALRIQRMCRDTRSGTATRAGIYLGLVHWRCALAMRSKTSRSHSGARRPVPPGSRQQSRAFLLPELSAWKAIGSPISASGADRSICEISDRTNSGRVPLAAVAAAVTVVHARACPDLGVVGATERILVASEAAQRLAGFDFSPSSPSTAAWQAEAPRQLSNAQRGWSLCALEHRVIKG